MTHQDRGKYDKKHPEGTKVDEILKREILNVSKDDRISCLAAEKVSRRTGRPLAEIGVAIDVLNINIAQCQLGLFGFSASEKRVPAAEFVAPDLEAVIREALVDGRLPCSAAWEIADRVKIKRWDVAAACENLKIKIKPCQLGAF
jgi:hypothetical protein